MASLIAVMVPLGAMAQTYPPAPPEAGAPPAPPPQPDAQGPQEAPPVTGFHLRGVVTDSQPYFVTLEAGGVQVPVQLHDGTVILPTGTTLQPGMRLAIDGYWIRHGGGPATFLANRIVLIR